MEHIEQLPDEYVEMEIKYREIAESQGLYDSPELNHEQTMALHQAVSTLSDLMHETNSSLSDLLKYNGYSF